jgi:hypothetical protein
METEKFAHPIKSIRPSPPTSFPSSSDESNSADAAFVSREHVVIEAEASTASSMILVTYSCQDIVVLGLSISIYVMCSSYGKLQFWE